MGATRVCRTQPNELANEKTTRIPVYKFLKSVRATVDRLVVWTWFLRAMIAERVRYTPNEASHVSDSKSPNITYPRIHALTSLFPSGSTAPVNALDTVFAL